MTYPVYRSEIAVEDPFADFKGNKPALPPLTTEAVASIFYMVDEEPVKH